MKKIRFLNYRHGNSGRQAKLLQFGNNSISLFSRFDEWLARKLLQAIGKPPVSLIFPDNRSITCTPLHTVAGIRVRNRTALSMLLLNPAFYFGELYSKGEVDIEGDLPVFLDSIYRYLPVKKGMSCVSSVIRKIFRNNSYAKTRENIHHHYDVGNSFYERWLDHDSMQYTCAYFPDPSMSLEQAQQAKMHHICRKLSLQPGQTVVEAGCGWGGFARFMAREYGVNVKAYNISHQQIVYADQKIREENLTGSVEFVEDDYRNIQGDYDVFVSIGMLEHIGPDNYHTLGEVINRVLKEDGKGLIHSIGRNQPIQLNEWIETRIFPGACPPSLSQMMHVFEPWSFSILDVENLRLHYALTLKHWLSRYSENMKKFEQAYDREFVRTWHLYLAGSVAAFTAGTMQLFQVLFARQHNNNLPWTRSYLYSDPQKGIKG